MKKAELVLKSTAVFTAVNDNVFKGGVAIAGNRIVAVGSDSEINEWIGPNTKVLEYGDELIMPGFNDAHVHLPYGSIVSDKSFTVELSQCNSQEECINTVKEFAEKNPNNEWIFGVGWYHLMWDNQKLPNRFSLDKVIPDRPICLVSADFHTLWANSKALEMCKIDNNTKNPSGGSIGRDEKGELNGLFYDEAGFLISLRALDPPKEKLKAIFMTFLENAAKLGITSISDLYPRGVGCEDVYQYYKELEDDGSLTLRIHFFPELKEDLREAKEFKNKYFSEKLRFAGLKQIVDGVSSVHTAYLLEPYTDDSTIKGGTVVSEEILKEQIMNADKEGFSVRLHTIGDGAVRFGLDCFEAAQMKNGRQGLRHALEHNENINESEISRFNKLGVIASMQPLHATFDIDGMVKLLGEERCMLAWPMKTLLKADTILAVGTDFPIVDLNPMRGIFAAVTRMTEELYPDGGWQPLEKLTMAGVLRAYTYGSAYSEGREKDLGTLEEGKLADIIVLNKNLFDIPEKDILKTKISLTVMDGKVVYED